MTFNSKDYWESRLSKDYTLRGVGDITLGVAYNNYIYKVRNVVFRRMVKKYKIEISGKDVVDIGSGTGFYVELFRQHGCRNLTGFDITNKVVSELSAKYPAFRFIQKDIGNGDFSFPDRFDIASSFDVLYHIVEDGKYETAIKNISSLVKEGGIFLYSDNFLPPGKRFEMMHQTCRDIDYIRKTMESNGFEIEQIVPMFVLMNTSFSNNFFLKRFFNWVTRIVQKGEFWSRLVGAILYPIELFLLSVMKRSSSTEIMICRKVK